MPATAKPFIARLGLAIGLSGSLATPALSIGLSTTGLYAVTTGGSEVIGFSLAGIQGPTFSRSGADVNVAISGALSVTKAITSSVATGTAPFVVASTTVVANLNASALGGKTFADPGGIGSTTAGTGAFSTLSASGVITSTLATGTAPFTVASTTVVGNLNVSQLLGATWASPAAIGTTTPAAATFSNVTNTAIPATRVVYAGTGGLMSSDSGFTRTSLALTIDSGLDGTYTVGRMTWGMPASGAANYCYIGNGAGFTSTAYALAFSTANTYLNAGSSVVLAIVNTPALTINSSSAVFSSVAPITANSTTDATSGTSGAINTLGGIGVTKALWVGTTGTFGTNISATGATSSVTIGNSTATAPRLTLNGAAGNIRGMIFQTAGSQRWLTYASAGAESGSDAGSAYIISAYTDAGGYIDDPLSIARPAGGTMTVTRPTTILSTTASTSQSTGCLTLLGGLGLAGSVYANGASAAGTQETFYAQGTSTITGAVTDGYTCALRLRPTYSAATALTVTRHNYISLNNVVLAGVGPAALTDACVFRFDAAAGTHKALNAATTKTTPGGWDGAMKVNVNGTIMYCPLYTSPTA